MILSELSLGDVGLGEPGLPQIGSYATPVYEIAERNFRVRLTAKQKPYAAAAMYRCADTAAKIEEHGWVFDMLDPVRTESRPAPAHYCQFKFLTDPQSAAAGWKVAIEGGTAVPQKPTIESSAESTR